MYRGKSCSLERKGRDQYVYQDAFTAQVKDAKGMLAYAEQQLAQAQRRVVDTQKIVELMQQELAQPQEVVTGVVKRYATGATGDPVQVAMGAPPPVPIEEKKRTSRGRR
jgi:hypothetical protein